MHRYLDQDLDPEETAQMYRHVAVCPACAENFNMLKSLSRDLEDLPAVTPPYSLVDAILPQLDAIDRAREERTEENIKGPAVMVPELKRSGRSASWWGSIAGRTVIGTAAAAVILGVAIFNYKPEMLSDAEMPFKEESMPTSSTNGSSISRELPEDEQMNKKFAATENAEDATEAEQPFAANDSREVLKEDTANPDESVSSQGGGSASDSGTMTKNQSPMDDPTSGGENPKQDRSGDTEPSQQAQNKTVPPQQGTQPDSRGSEHIQDGQKPTDQDEPGEGNQEPEAAKTDVYGITTMTPQQWPSPDGLYSASLEIDKLVMYRLPAAADQQPEAVHTLTMTGEWVAGEWSEDSKIFTYTVLVDQKEVKHQFNVEQPNQAEEVDRSSNTDTSAPVTTP